MKFQEYTDIIDIAIQDRWKTLEIKGMILEGPNVVESLSLIQYKVYKGNSVYDDKNAILIEHTRVPGGNVSREEISDLLEDAIKELS